MHFILEFGCRGFAVRLARGYPEHCYPHLVFRRSFPHDVATACAYGGRRWGFYDVAINKQNLNAEARGGRSKDVHISSRKRGKRMADVSLDVVTDLIKHQSLLQSTAHLVFFCNCT